MSQRYSPIEPLKRWLIPVVAVLLAVASVTGVIVLHRRADSDRQAQATLANAKTQFTVDAVAPLQLVGSLTTPSAVASNMRLNQGQVLSELEGLLAAWPTSALRGILGNVHSDFQAVDRIRVIMTRDPTFSDPGNILAGVQLGESENRAGNAAYAAIDHATKQYAARASAAETQANVGTIIAVGALLLCFLVFYWRWQRLLLATRRAASTDALTGLGNRRALIDGLMREMRTSAPQPLVLTLFDLDGFKGYNDTFGHLAGDALLVRVAGRLAEAVDGVGRAYRMGGDEFCCIARVERDRLEWLLATGTRALRETGEGFEIGCSAGSVLIPDEATGLDSALALADQRMYAQKAGGRVSASRQTADALLEVLRERDGALHDHTGDVAALAEETAQALGLSIAEVESVRLAAELHDIGKSAIPDAILNKPGKLDENEWRFIRQHTLIGERIIRAAPALAKVAGVVRASHERVDGTGYPDGLAGEDIPMGARIVAVCDAYDAMVAERPYRDPRTPDEALAELRRCTATQFDERVVDTVCTIVQARELQRSAA